MRQHGLHAPSQLRGALAPVWRARCCMGTPKPGAHRPGAGPLLVCHGTAQLRGGWRSSAAGDDAAQQAAVHATDPASPQLLTSRLKRAGSVEELAGVVSGSLSGLNHIHCCAALVRLSQLQAAAAASAPVGEQALGAAQRLLAQLLQLTGSQLDSLNGQGVATLLHALARLQPLLGPSLADAAAVDGRAGGGGMGSDAGDQASSPRAQQCEQAAPLRQLWYELLQQRLLPAVGAQAGSMSARAVCSCVWALGCLAQAHMQHERRLLVQLLLQQYEDADAPRPSRAPSDPQPAQTEGSASSQPAAGVGGGDPRPQLAGWPIAWRRPLRPGSTGTSAGTGTGTGTGTSINAGTSNTGTSGGSSSGGGSLQGWQRLAGTQAAASALDLLAALEAEADGAGPAADGSPWWQPGTQPLHQHGQQQPPPPPSWGLPRSWLPAVRQLMRASEQHMADCNAVDLCNLLQGVSRLAVYPGDTWQGALWGRSYQLLKGGSFSAAGLAAVVGALARLQLQPPRGWVVMHLRACSSAAHLLGPREIAEVLHAVSQLPASAACVRQLLRQPAPGQAAASQQAEGQSRDWQPRQARQPPPMQPEEVVAAVARAWAAELLASSGQQLASSAAGGSGVGSGDQGALGFTPQGLVLLGRGVAALQLHTTARWRQAWQGACQASLQRMSARDLAGVLHAAGDMHAQAASAAQAEGRSPPEPPPATWVADVLGASEPFLGAFNAQDCVEALNGLARLQFQPPLGWLRQALARSGQLLGSCTPADLALLAWALARLRSQPGGRWLPAWLARCQQGGLAGMQPRELVAAAWAAATWHAAAAAVGDGGAGGSRAAPAGRPWRQLPAGALPGMPSTTAWRIEPAQPRQEAGPLAGFGGALCDAAFWQLPYCRGGELAALLHSMGRLDAQPDGMWLVGLLHAAWPQLQACSWQELALAAHAFAALRIQPPKRWLQRHVHLLVQQQREQQRRLPAHALGMATWGLCELALGPEDAAWLGLFAGELAPAAGHLPPARLAAMAGWLRRAQARVGGDDAAMGAAIQQLRAAAAEKQQGLRAAAAAAAAGERSCGEAAGAADERLRLPLKQTAGAFVRPVLLDTTGVLAGFASAEAAQPQLVSASGLAAQAGDAASGGSSSGGGGSSSSASSSSGSVNVASTPCADTADGSVALVERSGTSPPGKRLAAAGGARRFVAVAAATSVAVPDPL